MKAIRQIACAVALAAMACSFAAAQTNVEDALKRIQSFEPGEREQAGREILALGEASVEAVADQLLVPAEGEDGGARMALHGLAVYCSRPGLEEARVVYVRAVASLLDSERPAPAKKFLIEQLRFAGREDAVPVLAKFLTGSDESLAESARQTIESIDGDAALAALRDGLPKTRGKLRVGIINTLGNRRDAKAVDALIAEARGDDEGVRVAALRALGSIGAAQADAVIAGALNDQSLKVSRAAEDASLLFGERLLEQDQKTAAGKMYAGLLGPEKAAHLHCAALIGLKRAGAITATDAILPYLSDEDAAVRQAAIECLDAFPQTQVSAALNQAVGKAQPHVKAALIRTMAEHKDPMADKVINESVNDPNAEVRIVAYDLLGKLDDPALEPVMLEAAKTSAGRNRSVALSAYLRQAKGRLDKGEPARALEMFKQAYDLAPDNADIRRNAVRGFGEAASAESIPMIEAFIEDRGVRNEALAAYVAVARTLAQSGERERAKKILYRAVEMRPPRDVLERAGKQLRALGEDFDLARNFGFITNWHFIGPFPGVDINQAHAPEQGVDLAKKVQVGGEEKPWQAHHTDHEQGIVDLAQLMKPSDNVTGYLYAEINVDAAQNAFIRSGSDDGMKIWVNGEEVFKMEKPRGLEVDQDRVRVGLKGGVNTILVKVVNHGGGWSSVVRLADRQNQAIRFNQK